MFRFLDGLKKAGDCDIYSPILGKCIDITKTKDDVFSKKMIGDGIAVIPESNIVYAPCDGKLTMIFPTKHAFGITMDNGVEVLVHIGIDTVNLNGEGFKVYKSKGDKVKHGDKIIEFDDIYLHKEDLDMTVMVIITNSNNYQFDKIELDKDVGIESKVLLKKDTE